MSSATTSLAEIRELVAAVPDPEVPVLTILDLGVLRSVEEVDGQVVVTITPTYSGCPAMHHIENAILEVIEGAGATGSVRTVFSPAWTTEWMSDEGKIKLREYGIAPPRPMETAVKLGRSQIPCPLCGSTNTEVISDFGSTACKALRRCTDCLEPFDHFKEL